MDAGGISTKPMPELKQGEPYLQVEAVWDEVENDFLGDLRPTNYALHDKGAEEI